MLFSEKINSDVKTVALEFGNGWSGRAALSDSCGKTFSKTGWEDCLSQPQLLFEGTGKILKTEGRNCVVAKNLALAGCPLKVVVKRHYPPFGFRQFFRSLRPGKALRNFKTAIELLGCSIPVAAPLAAIQQKKFFLMKQSIYITKYYENSSNLYNFLSEQLHGTPLEQFHLKKQLCLQLAAILASLHKNGFWHRDSKAANFIVDKNSRCEYKILLTDMDGIKHYFLRHKACQLRSLWRLAASLIPVSTVNKTDYLRTFTAYCNLIGLNNLSQRRQVFRELLKRAQAKYLKLVGKRL